MAQSFEIAGRYLWEVRNKIPQGKNNVWHSEKKIFQVNEDITIWSLIFS